MNEAVSQLVRDVVSRSISKKDIETLAILANANEIKFDLSKDLEILIRRK